MDTNDSQQKNPLDIGSGYFDEHPERVTSAHLNNLYLKLPGAWGKETDELLQNQNSIHTDIADVLGQTREDLNSKKIIELLPKILATQKAQSDQSDIEIRNMLINLRNRQTESLNEDLLPLYHILRQRGYSHQEIVE